MAEIAFLASSQDLDSQPWMIFGDFNQIRVPAEHSVPASLNIDKRMRAFSQCLLDANVEDLNFRGTTFTWWNKQKRSPIAKKLDRCLVNGEWYCAWPASVVIFGSPEFSDHAVISISLEPDRVRVKKPFRFFNFLIKNPEFTAMICVNWFSFNITGSAMFRVSMKLKLLKKCIKDFSRLNYSGIEAKTAVAHDKLIQAQQTLLSSPTVINATAELQALKEWEELSTAEAAFFFQRARINWLAFGDGNSTLFHRYASTRQAINHIHFLIAGSGERIESQEGIQTLCVDYFTDLLGGETSQPMFVQEDLDLLFDFKCSTAQIESFAKDFSSEDIKNAFSHFLETKVEGQMAILQNSSSQHGV